MIQSPISAIVGHGSSTSVPSRISTGMTSSVATMTGTSKRRVMRSARSSTSRVFDTPVPGPHGQARALMAVLMLAGLRIDEALSLRWWHVDLAGGRLKVPGTKTDAAARVVPLLPLLRDELLAHAARRTPRLGRPERARVLDRDGCEASADARTATHPRSGGG